MNPILYFLRSSEQKITTDMLHYAMRLDEVDKTLQDLPELDIYHKFYGLTTKDLGLYALDDSAIVGAVWIRLLSKDSNATAFVDDKTPILNIAVKPKFRSRGIGSAMMQQLLLEAGAIFEQISVSVLSDSKAVRFYKKFGFEKVANSEVKSLVDDKKVFTMVKKLKLQEVQRPTDGYDPRRWMD